MTRWISEHLGSAAWGRIDESPGIHLLDVRDLVDKGGNPPTAVKSKIDEALRYLGEGNKVVVCCDYGISRSNAIAAGILTVHEGISLDEAIQRVLTNTGEKAIRIEVLSTVRKALGLEEQIASEPSAAERRLLVTGASGFIGSSLVGELGLRDKIVTPTHQEVDLVCGTTALDLLVKEQGINTILHLATPRVYTTNESLGTALVMLKNVLDVCAENRLFLLYLSSWEIYSGYKARELRADETLPPRPGGTYGQTKLLCETLIQHYHDHHGISYSLLRSSPVYGPESDRPKFIWNFLEKALRNEDIVAHRYLNGYPMLALLHVDDVRAAIISAIEHCPQGSINLGTGIGTTTTEVAERIIELVGSQSAIRYVDIDGYASNVIMDVSRAAVMLGWRPAIDLARGLETIVRASLVREVPAT